MPELAPTGRKQRTMRRVPGLPETQAPSADEGPGAWAWLSIRFQVPSSYL